MRHTHLSSQQIVRSRSRIRKINLSVLLNHFFYFNYYQINNTVNFDAIKGFHLTFGYNWL